MKTKEAEKRVQNILQIKSHENGVKPICYCAYPERVNLKPFHSRVFPFIVRLSISVQSVYIHQSDCNLPNFWFDATCEFTTICTWRCEEKVLHINAVWMLAIFHLNSATCSLCFLFNVHFSSFLNEKNQIENLYLSLLESTMSQMKQEQTKHMSTLFLPFTAYIFALTKKIGFRFQDFSCVFDDSHQRNWSIVGLKCLNRKKKLADIKICSKHAQHQSQLVVYQFSICTHKYDGRLFGIEHELVHN